MRQLDKLPSFTVSQISLRLWPRHIHPLCIWISVCNLRNWCHHISLGKSFAQGYHLAAPVEVYCEQINRCSGHDYVTIIHRRSLVKPGERWFEERCHTSWHSSCGWKSSVGNRAVSEIGCSPCFRTSWLESRIRASPLVSTCRMLLKCSKSSHYLLHFLADWLSLQVSQLLCPIAWNLPA